MRNGLFPKTGGREMLSYVCEFNLAVRGDHAERYLTRVLREWPPLYAELEGVRGTLLLANAFALAGNYTYLWRVDVESFRTLQVIDDALTSDDRRWRRARSEWFEHRSDVRARLLRGDGPADVADGLVHFILAHGAANGGSERTASSAREEVGRVWRQRKGVQTVEHLTAVVQPFSGERYEAWARLDGLETLEEVVQANDEELAPLLETSVVSSRAYGELREVDGALLAGA
jgi:hypothetical protein